MRTHLVCTTTALSLLVAVAATAWAVDWPCFRGPDLNGISKETGWLEAFTSEKAKVLWSTSVGTGFSSMAVANGRVYTVGFAGNRDTLYCFDAASGEKVWTYSYPAAKGAKYYEGGPHATPTVDGDRVYTTGKWGWLFCLKVADGKLIWKKNVAGAIGAQTPTWGFASSPLVIGNALYLNIGASAVALDKATGKVKWGKGGMAGYATPVPYQSGDTSALAVFGQNALLGVRVSDGKVLWRFPWRTKYDVNAADPIVIDKETFFISSGYNHGCAMVKISDGKPRQLWMNANMRNQFSSCVRLGDYLYGFDESTLVCLKIADGSKVWSRNGLGKGSLMMADGKLIILAEKGTLVIAEASPTGYKALVSKRLFSGGRIRCWTSPVLADGRIYARNANGKLVCYGPKQIEGPADK